VLEAGEVRALFRLAATVSTDSYDISAAGERFLIVPPEASTEGVIVVQKWAAGLKK
jgi:hypothetical protein